MSGTSRRGSSSAALGPTDGRVVCLALAAMVQKHHSFSRKECSEEEIETGQKSDVFGECRTEFVNERLFILRRIL